MAMMGLPSQSFWEYPICFMRERWPKERRSSGAIQRELRKESYVFRGGLVGMWYDGFYRRVRAEKTGGTFAEAMMNPRRVNWRGGAACLAIAALIWSGACRQPAQA